MMCMRYQAGAMSSQPFHRISTVAGASGRQSPKIHCICSNATDGSSGGIHSPNEFQAQDASYSSAQDCATIWR